jgi:WD40 repeat protein
MKLSNLHFSNLALIAIVAICFSIAPLVMGASYGASYLSNISSGPTTHSITLVNPDPQKAGFFGRAVATRSDLVVVGATDQDVDGITDAGRVDVYIASDGQLIQSLNSPHPQPGGFFGSSVAVSGNLAIVGAIYETVQGFSEAGHVYVFNAITGNLVHTLSSPNSQTDGLFGSSIAADGNLAIVGAYAESSNGHAGGGNVYVYNTSTWELIRTLSSPNVQRDGEFGSSVAISGDQVVVAANNETVDDYSGAGRAYIFNAETGALIQSLTSPGEQLGDFAQSVSISGNIAMVGDPHGTAEGYSYAGVAYVFNVISGKITETLASPNAQADGLFGNSVGISGKFAVVGAHFEIYKGYTYAGNAYVFNARTGALIENLTTANVHQYGLFGSAVAINGRVIVVGAPDEAEDGTLYAGNAYLFRA